MAKEEFPECPVCEKWFYSQHALTKHLLDPENTCLPRVQGAMRARQCWCGIILTFTHAPLFFAHLKEHGGARMHYLDCLMGVKPETP